MTLSALYPVSDLVDVSGTTASSLIVGREGFLNIEECFVKVTTVLSSSTATVVDLKVGSTVVGQATLGLTEADNTQVFFVPVTAYVNNPNFQFADAATIAIVASTVATSSGVVEGVLALTQPRS